MKKMMAVLLALLMLLAAAPASADAPKALMSRQAFTLDGEAVECVAYNIDGYNYFRLRDLAELLSGTDCRFSVEWDQESWAVRVETDRDYDSAGAAPLDGKDLSGTAVPSTQALFVNGGAVTGLNIFNIGGSNFFRLAELQPLLGYILNYDEGTNTVEILTEKAALERTFHVGAESGWTGFDSTLIDCLEKAGHENESFLFSPLSFRAALALAAAGARGDTLRALLNAMNFSSLEEAEEWYAGLIQGEAAFAAGLAREKAEFENHPDFYGGTEPDRAFSIANSIWHNASKDGAFLDSFVNLTRDCFGAEAANVPGDELKDEINSWVNEKTGGMIPSIVGDVSDMEAVLVNALYLRTSWTESFHVLPQKGEFTAIDGSTVEKVFMRRHDGFKYYEDGETQLVSVPMDGNIRAVFVLGDTAGFREKLENAAFEDVIVTLPEFEVETSLDQGELTDYLRECGAGIVLTDRADFSGMSDTPWLIGDILQKSKIKTDEDGIEAAAVTAIVMDTSAMPPENPPPPKEFTADGPFTFYLFSDCGDSPELLFFGQLVR